MIVDTTQTKMEHKIETEQLLKAIEGTAKWLCSKFHDTYSGTGYISYASPKITALIKKADDSGISSAAIMERVIRGIIFEVHANEQRHKNGTQYLHDRPVDFEGKRSLGWSADYGPTSISFSRRENENDMHSL